MQKITDERLALQNLRNIRIAYIIQTLGILGILGYDLITKGLDGMKDNPLWFVFIITSVISAYLSISISVDHESKINPQKSLIISVIVLVLISTSVGFLVSFTDGYNIINGLIMGGILFICGIIPIVYIYNIRKKRQENYTEE
ncbi:hypothetical protein ABER68_22095 [Paenibacillus alvei]|uniref:hypothetical protein n=1 Tax=Niallia sp. FSL R7-0271 TaxID=2921678 RepID=UPI0030FB3524